MQRTYVIAEAGSCHDGVRAHALEMVAIARQCGADAVKFQYFGKGLAGAREVAHRRSLPETYAKVYAGYTTDGEWLPDLADLARIHGLDFMCTAFTPQDVTVVAPLVRHFKVASLEAEDAELLKAIKAARREAGQRVFISLGLGATPAAAKRIIPDAEFLHCVSAYPTPLDELNLGRAGRYRGFSDHSMPTAVQTGAMAVMAGAAVVEVHFRLSATSPNAPDYGHSRTPHELATYVEAIRRAEVMLGDGEDAMRRSEHALAEIQGRRRRQDREAQ